MYIKKNIEELNEIRKKERLAEKEKFFYLIDKTLNNKEGKELLEIIKRSLRNKRPDFNNPNYLYYNNGRIDIINMLENEIERINNKEKYK